MFLLSSCIGKFLLGNESLADKLVFLVVGGAILVIATVFEGWRVAREQEREEADWKMGFGSDE